ncbi:TetR family transcriptional regulator C-terminal domain-containing protein [Phytohabitans houttuyneae]|uniref:TetR family transcriptional regulator n=1 Tax=Phytohabitans houttuyneae TaxID=1076126 RepID=A0A6V8KIX0_9ACTN|nr:TetR family transcriptional regulator C-terminal domain-containing protein [Phytohabitans houttuyneae]GFJ81916.1 hypothetical protein Phou_060960 [Phytohabitans houttuyneae]
MGLKDTLPYPYNLDLSPVLHGLARRTEVGRRRLANDPVTASYLAAGMRLLERHLGQGEEAFKCDDADNPERPLLKLLSQRAVADEITRNPEPFIRQGTTSTLRATWQSQPHYIADLLRFGLWSQRYAGLYAGELAAYVEDLVSGPHLIEAIHAITAAHVEDSVERPRFRLQLLAAATAEGDDVIRQAMTDNYREVERTWAAVFEEMIGARQLELRPGITVEHMVTMVVGAVEGISLRALLDNERVFDDRETRRLMGTMAAALLIGIIRPQDGSLNETVEQALGRIANL